MIKAIHWCADGNSVTASVWLFNLDLVIGICFSIRIGGRILVRRLHIYAFGLNFWALFGACCVRFVWLLVGVGTSDCLDRSGTLAFADLGIQPARDVNVVRLPRDRFRCSMSVLRSAPHMLRCHMKITQILNQSVQISREFSVSLTTAVQSIRLSSIRLHLHFQTRYQSTNSKQIRSNLQKSSSQSQTSYRYLS